MPANQIVGLAPGEVFVHRNVANVVVHTDLNCLSVLQYAVDVLGVKHVIVCGHYGCGGVRAALDGSRHGLIDNWLRHVTDVAEKHADELAALDEEPRFDRLCELNVVEQVVNVCQTTIVEDAWARGQDLTVHGVVYGLEDGLLRELGDEHRFGRSGAELTRDRSCDRQRAVPSCECSCAPAVLTTYPQGRKHARHACRDSADSAACPRS